MDACKCWKIFGFCQFFLFKSISSCLLISNWPKQEDKYSIRDVECNLADLKTTQIIISTEGALRRPLTYDNHPIHPQSHLVGT